MPELTSVAQQHSSGPYHFYMYTDPELKPRTQKKPTHVNDFERYRLERRITDVFGDAHHTTDAATKKEG